MGGVDLGASILRHPPSRPAPFLTPPNPLQFPLAVHIRHQVFVWLKDRRPQVAIAAALRHISNPPPSPSRSGSDTRPRCGMSTLRWEGGGMTRRKKRINRGVRGAFGARAIVWKRDIIHEKLSIRARFNLYRLNVTWHRFIWFTIICLIIFELSHLGQCIKHKDRGSDLVHLRDRYGRVGRILNMTLTAVPHLSTGGARSN